LERKNWRKSVPTCRIFRICLPGGWGVSCPPDCLSTAPLWLVCRSGYRRIFRSRSLWARTDRFNRQRLRCRLNQLPLPLFSWGQPSGRSPFQAELTTRPVPISRLLPGRRHYRYPPRHSDWPDLRCTSCRRSTCLPSGRDGRRRAASIRG